jgi:hypothetical protein
LGGLLGPVGGVVLDNAQGVDPEVGDVETACEGNGVLEGLGEGVEGDLLLEGGEVLLCEHDGEVAAPAVAECCVSFAFSLGDMEVDVGIRLADGEDPAGQASGLDGWTGGMLRTRGDLGLNPRK